jgi:hypothetical protein
MPETCIYKIPLVNAYKYSLIYEDHIHPEQLDAEGTLHQRLIHDEKKRLIKIENYADGNLVSEKTFEFEGERLKKEREYFNETESASEIVYSYTEEGVTKEYYTENELEFREILFVNDKGVATAFEYRDAEGELVKYWEANDRGDVIRSEDENRLCTYEYVYNEDGQIAETRVKDGDKEVREVMEYKDKKVSKAVNFIDGESSEYSTFEYDNEGKVSCTQRFVDNVLANETAVQIDPAGKYSIRFQKLLLHAKAGSRAREVYRSGKVEILFDDYKRITDVLTSGDSYVDQSSGINLEPDAYYFFEYEE